MATREARTSGPAVSILSAGPLAVGSLQTTESDRPLAPADADAVSNGAAFSLGLRKIGLRLLDAPLGYLYGPVLPVEPRAGAARSSSVDPALRRFSAKIGLAATLAYVVGVASQRSELGAAVWTAH